MKPLVRFGALNAAGHGYIDANAIISIAFTNATTVTVTYAPSRVVTITVTSDPSFIIHNYIADILIGAAQSSVKPSAGASSSLAIPSSVTIGATTYTISFSIA